MVFQTAIFSVVWKGFHICLSLLFWFPLYHIENPWLALGNPIYKCDINKNSRSIASYPVKKKMCQFLGSVDWYMGMSGLEICLPLPVPHWNSLFSTSHKPVHPWNQCDKNIIASAQVIEVMVLLFFIRIWILWFSKQLYLV
jgi:hypothetical protein